MTPPPCTSDAAKAFLVAKQAEGISDWTFKWYRSILNALAGETAELPRTPEVLEAWLAGVAGRVSRSRLCGYHRALRVFFAWAARRYRVPDPMKKISRPREEKTLRNVLTQDEVRALFTAAGNRRDLAMVAILRNCGIRIGELWALRRSHVGEETIRVYRKRRWRDVPISREVRQLLTGVGQGDYLWIVRGTTYPLSYFGVYAAVRRVLARAGVDAAPHDVRHTFATGFRRAGGDSRDLQRILGHEDLKTTEIYDQYITADLVAAHRRYDETVKILAGTRRLFG